jgi:precorrin-6A synthase
MRTILIIGIGAGNPDHLTLQAARAIGRVDTFFIPDKGETKSDLSLLRRQILSAHASGNHRSVDFAIPERARPGDSYRQTVSDWHAAIEEQYRRLFFDELQDGQTGGFLVWGDPALYDSVIRIVERMARRMEGLEYEVIPGISSLQALAAAHRIALNTIGNPVHITTGRRLAREGMPAGCDSIAVMLDGEQAFLTVNEPDVTIWWGAYVGTPDEILIAGPLAQVGGLIVRERQAARDRHGWIMDIYLLRRPAG